METAFDVDEAASDVTRSIPPSAIGFVLYYSHCHDGIDAAEAIRRLMAQPQTVTDILERLHSAGAGDMHPVIGDFRPLDSSILRQSRSSSGVRAIDAFRSAPTGA